MYLPSMIQNSDASILFLIQMRRLQFTVWLTLELPRLHGSEFKIMPSETCWLLATLKHIVALQDIHNRPLIQLKRCKIWNTFTLKLDIIRNISKLIKDVVVIRRIFQNHQPFHVTVLVILGSIRLSSKQRSILDSGRPQILPVCRKFACKNVDSSIIRGQFCQNRKNGINDIKSNQNVPWWLKSL